MLNDRTAEVRLWSRREWLRSAGIALGALVLPIGCGRPGHRSTQAFAPSAWLSVNPDGRVEVTILKSEMGQGVRTTLALVVADELGAAWDQVDVRQADTNAPFGEFSTGGSSSLEDSWLPLRITAAAAREMLTRAAALRWRVAEAECTVQSGRIAHARSHRELSFGALTTQAALLRIPAHPALKQCEDFRLIGRRIPRIDISDITSGRAVYGIDISIPGMRYAAIARCPFQDGVLEGFDGVEARRVTGVLSVIVVPHLAAGHEAGVRPGVAVIATDSYAALRAAQRLAVRWQPPPRPLLDTNQLYEALKSMPRELARTVISKDSTVDSRANAPSAAGQAFTADYLIPYAAHAAMEPLNCTAAAGPGGCEIWVGSQTPTNTQRLVAHALGIAPRGVILHTLLLGGGFGRRLNADFVVEAALVSKAIGAPVKVIWSREADLQNDFYRSVSYQSLNARVSTAGTLLSWNHLLVGPSTVRQIDGAATVHPERQEILGLERLPYAIPRYRVDYLECDPARIPIGWWRGIANTQNLFAVESFMSEMAASLGIDPIDFRLRHITDPRLKHVIEMVRRDFQWHTRPSAGSAYGFAACSYHGRTRVALALEADWPAGSVLRVRRVTCGVDCGLVVHPGIVESQVEGAIVWGLSAALTGEVTLEKGRIAISNFNDYPVLRIAETPHIDVRLVPSLDSPSGIGEPVVPVVAPALAAAASQLLGNRINRLPIR